MAKTFMTFVVVVDRSAAGTLLRDGVRQLHLGASGGPQPAPGDRVAVLSTLGPSFVSAAEFIATARVRAAGDGGVALRHRAVAPTGHAIPLRALPSLRVAARWTNERLGGLRGGVVRCSARDFERIDEALLQAALRFGPHATRPTHTRPRTPGRRALLAGRAAAGRRP